MSNVIPNILQWLFKVATFSNINISLEELLGSVVKPIKQS